MDIKKYFFSFFMLMFCVFLFSFSKRALGYKSILQNSYRNFTCSGDINFDITDTVSTQFLKLTVEGRKIISLVATNIGKDSSFNPLSIVILGDQKGWYSLHLTNNSNFATINYTSVNKNTNANVDVFMSLNNDDGSGFVKIDSLSDNHISGSYKASIANTNGKIYNINGTFAGSLTNVNK